MADMEVQNLNELLQIRRDKLTELQEAGRDPFVITKYDVTHHSSDIRDNYDELEGKEVAIAGRMMSRAQARATLSMEDYREQMKNVFSTSVTEATIDEAPGTYKPMDEILRYIGDTVEVESILKPIYNFKAG